MKDVAALAGVSLATVSRVVNGNADVRVDLVINGVSEATLRLYDADFAKTDAPTFDIGKFTTAPDARSNEKIRASSPTRSARAASTGW